VERILDSVREYYTAKIEEYGPTPEGVDWNSLESQQLRFEQLAKVCDASLPFSINDYGCGYGALVDYLVGKGYAFHYHGFDISDRMIDKAEELHQELSGCQFTTDGSTLRVADYTVASGIFNVKLRNRDDEWREHVLSTLHTIAELSDLGFAFNALTIYSDPEFMRPDLFYADPLHLFDYCKRNFSRFVTVLHDYPLYEFTILVRM
jgi:SAM-dependent methyltransferase